MSQKDTFIPSENMSAQDVRKRGTLIELHELRIGDKILIGSEVGNVWAINGTLLTLDIGERSVNGVAIWRLPK